MSNQIYTIDMLRYYPIIVDNFDMTSESSIMELLQGCIAFADTSFDYLVVLFANEFDEINSIALQCSRQMFLDVRAAIESENSSLLDKLMLPYPVDVTSQMLKRTGTETHSWADFNHGLFMLQRSRCIGYASKSF